MKRSFTFSTSLAVGALTLLAASPAVAEEFYTTTGEDGAFAALGCGIWICIMIPVLLLAVLQIWMLIDAIMRQEYEFPNSSGNSKLIWILLLVFASGIAAIVYYFMVFKKIKRGSGPSAGAGGPGAGYQPPTAPPPMAPPMAPPPPPMAPPAPPTPPGPPPAGPMG